MDVNVYIKNSAFQEIGQGMNIESDKSMDGISRMCISVVDELFQGIGNCPRDVPVFFGSAYSSTSSLHQFNIVCESAGALQVNPSLFPNTVLNAPFCRASIYHRITSPIFNICQGNASAMTALKLAYDHMIYGGVHQAIVCAAEEACHFINKVHGKKLFSSCGALYLTDIEGKWEIAGFANTQSKDMDNLYGSYGSASLLYKVHRVLNTSHMELRKENQEKIISITDGNKELILSGC